RDVPAYVVFSDVALRQMAREYPSNEREFSRISGVGATKLREFSALFLREIAEHLGSNERLQFTASRPAEGMRSEPRSGRGRLGDSPASTLRQFRAGRSPAEIARERGFVLGTIMSHLVLAAEAGEDIDLTRFLTSEQGTEIEEAFRTAGWQNIVGARERIGGRYSYELLCIYRATRLAKTATVATQSLPAGAAARSRAALRRNRTGALFSPLDGFAGRALISGRADGAEVVLRHLDADLFLSRLDGCFAVDGNARVGRSLVLDTDCDPRIPGDVLRFDALLIGPHQKMPICIEVTDGREDRRSVRAVGATDSYSAPA